MTVHIEFSSIFAIEGGRSGLELDIPEAQVELKDLLARVAEWLEGKGDPLIYATDRPGINMGLMVKWNDEILTGGRINQQSHWIRDGDSVTLLYIVSGG